MPRILLVDDEDDLRESVQFLLRGLGIRRITAVRGIAEAERALKNANFDVIITDYHLLDGLGTDILRGAFPVPGILMTGDPKSRPIRDALDARAVFYLPKPFSACDLAQALKKALKNHPEELERIIQFVNQRFRMRAFSLSFEASASEQARFGTAASPEPSRESPSGSPRRTRRGPRR